MTFVLTLDDIVDIIIALICLGLFCYCGIFTHMARKEKEEMQRKAKGDDQNDT